MNLDKVHTNSAWRNAVCNEAQCRCDLKVWFVLKPDKVDEAISVGLLFPTVHASR